MRSANGVEEGRSECVGSFLNRPLYLGYDLSFSYCIKTLYNALKEYCPTLLLGEVIHSQNLSQKEVFGSEYLKLGYHYFKTPSVDPTGILLFLSKDGSVVSDYHANGNLFSVLLDSGLPQASVFSDYQLQTVVQSMGRCEIVVESIPDAAIRECGARGACEDAGSGAGNALRGSLSGDVESTDACC